MRLLTALGIYMGSLIATGFFTKNSGVKNQLFWESTISLFTVLTLWLVFKPPYTFEFSLKFWWIFAGILVFEFFVFKLEEQTVPSWILKDPRVIISIVLISPIAEEMFFRGVVLSMLESPVWNGLIFAAFHLVNLLGFERFSIGVLITRFSLGFVMALATAKSGSVFPAILYHIANNALAVLANLR